jgi:hypothetical protein
MSKPLAPPLTLAVPRRVKATLTLPAFAAPATDSDMRMLGANGAKLLGQIIEVLPTRDKEVLRSAVMRNDETTMRKIMGRALSALRASAAARGSAPKDAA